MIESFGNEVSLLAILEATDVFSPILAVAIRVSFRSTNNDISVMRTYNVYEEY